MGINIDTQSQKYQGYLAGLGNLRDDMIPRLKAFSKLSKLKQKVWLDRDPLMRRLIKLSLVVSKHVNIENHRENVQYD